MRFKDDDQTKTNNKRGSSCDTNALCMTADDFIAIRSYVEERNIEPLDHGKRNCCFLDRDGACMVWDVRPQACQPQDSKSSGDAVHPDAELGLKPFDGMWLVDMHEAFVEKTVGHDFTPDKPWSTDGQSPAYLAATRMASLNDNAVAAIHDHLRIKPGMKVLDVGCGSGEYTFRLGSHIDGVSFTGLDYDPRFVQFSTDRASNQVGYPFEIPNPENEYRFVCATSMHMPFDDETFDHVVSHTFLTATPDWAPSLEEMKRVCKPGGTISSVTSLTDDFYGTGTIGLFSDKLAPRDQQLASRVQRVKDQFYPYLDLVYGVAPRDVPAAFERAGLKQVCCLPIGHYFCLSDGALRNAEYMRHVELLRMVEEEELERMLANPAAKAKLPEKDWEAYAQLIATRYDELASMAGANREWNWYGNSSLLVSGQMPRRNAPSRPKMPKLSMPKS